MADASTSTPPHHPPRSRSNPLMPPAKQERIHVWRTEVASALSLPLPYDSPSLASSLSSSDHETSPECQSPSPSRPRTLWKRLSWKFSSKKRSTTSPTATTPTTDAGHDLGRTAMYRGLEDRARRGDGLDEEPGILERDDDEAAARGLRGKQERLLRASTLR